MSEFLVHAEHITYLTATNTDIACWYILVWTYMTVKLCHECLTETHYLSIALSTCRKVGASLCTTHRESGQRVLECLLESEELQDRQVY